MNVYEGILLIQYRLLKCIYSHYHILPTTRTLPYNDLPLYVILLILIFYNFSKHTHSHTHTHTHTHIIVGTVQIIKIKTQNVLFSMETKTVTSLNNKKPQELNCSPKQIQYIHIYWGGGLEFPISLPNTESNN